MPSYYRSIIFITTALLSACQTAPEEQDPVQLETNRIVQQTINNMVFVEGGSYMMGDFGVWETDESGRKYFLHWSSEKNDDFLHKVTLDSFSINKFEVTWEEFDAFSVATGREIFKQGKWYHLPNIPAYMPNWYEAKAYCEWLAQQSGLAFDMPTEAQWEYAARSRGQDLPFATNDGMIDLKGSNIKGWSVSQEEPVVGDYYPSNPLGLHHMSGNVGEYVKDWFSEDYYQLSSESNPLNIVEAEKKVYRGGSNASSSRFNLTMRRGYAKPNEALYVGLRCIVNLKEPI